MAFLTSYPGQDSNRFPGFYILLTDTNKYHKVNLGKASYIKMNNSKILTRLFQALSKLGYDCCGIVQANREDFLKGLINTKNCKVNQGVHMLIMEPMVIC